MGAGFAPPVFDRQPIDDKVTRRGNPMNRTFHRIALASLAAAALAAMSLPTSGAVGTHAALASSNHAAVRFPLVRSAGAVKANCLPNARGVVRVTPGPLNDLMQVAVAGLPPETDFDLFVTQLPNAPFGVAWYQSDLHTDDEGEGYVQVRGIFDVETFSLSLGGPSNGEVATQNVTGTAVTDTNAVVRPTHQYHLGLWFNSPDDAAKAGCPGAVTPFNGEQHAGVQALTTQSLSPADPGLGPLSQVHR
jgi:hypothetical protein